MADLVAFGVAPGILVFNIGIEASLIEVFSANFWTLILSVGFFILCGAMRLARFNVRSDDLSEGWFNGVPITGAGGGLVATACILLVRYAHEAELLQLHLYLPIAMLVLGLLMISSVRFPKAKIRGNIFINAFQALTALAAYYFGLTRTFPEYLFLMSVFLLIVGLIVGRLFLDNESN